MTCTAPFAEGKHDIFKNELLRSIGAKHGKSIAQVILRWLLQRGVVVIPKSVRRERMEENIAVFDFALDDAEMASIVTLDTKTSSFFDHRDPAMVKWLGTRRERKAMNQSGLIHLSLFVSATTMSCAKPVAIRTPGHSTPR